MRSDPRPRRRYRSKHSLALRAEQAHALAVGRELVREPDHKIPCHVCGQDCGDGYRIVVPLPTHILVTGMTGKTKAKRAVRTYHISRLSPRAVQLGVVEEGARIHPWHAEIFDAPDFLVSITYTPANVETWARINDGVIEE